MLLVPRSNPSRFADEVSAEVYNTRLGDSAPADYGENEPDIRFFVIIQGLVMSEQDAAAMPVRPI